MNKIDQIEKRTKLNSLYASHTWKLTNSETQTILKIIEELAAV